MNNDRRKLILKLAGDDVRCLPIIHPLEQFRRRDDIYRWLIRNNLTGKKFFEFAHEFKFSWLRIGKFVLTRIDSVKKEVIIGQKDTF